MKKTFTFLICILLNIAALAKSSTELSSTKIFNKADPTYCAAAGASAASYWMSNISVANIVNPTAGTVYSNFTVNPALEINVSRGTTYPVTIKANVVAANFASVFLDYNRDGVFDASERVLNFPVANTDTFTGSFTVPNDAVFNTTF